jgi:diguanylate cyclase (GGDEF)-like protein/PAS domain S-box-containing protein
VQQRRRRASAGWLLAVPVLTGAVGGGALLPAGLLLLAAALATAVVLWRSAPLIRARLRFAGARLLTETALFFSASTVLAQVLVVGPALGRGPLTASTRLVLELGCVLGAAVLSAVLVLVSLSATGGHAVGNLTITTARPTPARQMLPHLVLVAATVAYLGAPIVDDDPPPAAGVALVCCVALTAVNRWLAARDEASTGSLLRRSEAYFRSLVRSSSYAVLILDLDLRVTWAAPSLEPAGDAPGLAGRVLPDAVHPDDAAAVRRWLTGEAAPAGLLSFRLRDRTGDWRVLEAGVSDLRGDSDVRGLVLHCRDVTARQDREHQLSSLAFIDPLTGLPNRAAQRELLTDRLAGLAARTPADDRAEDATLLLIEVQGLDEAGEVAGRDVVDVALREVARRLRDTVRAEDQVARIGPALFGVLAHGTGDEPDRVAARCLAVIEAPIRTEAGIIDLSAAVGLALLEAGLTVHSAVDRAELALADARGAATGSVRRYRTELAAARDRREQLRRDLVGALDRRELDLVWQPIVALTDHRITGVEALLRWQHPLHGDVPPEEFLPIAERAGLAVELQRWMLHAATAAAATLPVQGAELKLGVNVTGQHLTAGTLVGDVTSALRVSGLPPERLVVEVVESALAGDRLADDLTALRLMGVHLALDDFGRGATSLAGLGRVPVDIVKLDRSLLSRIDRDPYIRALCAAVVGLGAALSVDVVAEGVETASQLGILQALGCGFAQGFLLSRPVTLTGLVQLLAADEGRLWPGIVGRVETG